MVSGGVAGLILLGRSLGRARVSLIDRKWIHVWKPMLHTFAVGTWNINEQQVQYVAHARTHHFVYVPGPLDAISAQPDASALRWRRGPARWSLALASWSTLC